MEMDHYGPEACGSPRAGRQWLTQQFDSLDSN